MMADTDQVTAIVTRTDRLTMNREDSWSAPGASPAVLQPGGLWRLDSSARTFVARLSKFLLVGGVGVLVNSVALLLLYQGAHLPLVVASALSVELAIVSNFLWNDRWTFGRRERSLGRFARFNLVSLAGLLITTFTLWVLVHHLGFYYLAANLLGIGLATAWNFAANLLWTWRDAQ